MSDIEKELFFLNFALLQSYFRNRMKKRFITFLLTTIARIPLPGLYLVSDFFYPVVYHIVKYRRKVVRENLTSAFPEKTHSEILRIEKRFYRFLCDVIVETVKLLHISNKELTKRVSVKNYELVNESVAGGKCAVLLLGHYGNWEWVQEITRYFAPEAFNISIYHPLKDKLWDDIFLKLRGRWQAHIVPMKKAVRTLLDRNNFPWICGFIADHRPYLKEEKNAIDFIHHTTYFIYNPEEIGKKVNADFFYLEMKREKRGYYNIIFHKLAPSDTSLPYPYTRSFWKLFEKTIMEEPALWMWSHKRWKQ